uniref:Fmp27_GFWDK domain-containing protein n=1 Tax=Rhabditophanes sp. KR3021 TaxID=114890 RepID=A0AC35UCY3_9BILA
METTTEFILANSSSKPEPIVPTNAALKSCLIILLFVVTFLASMGAFMLRKAATAGNNQRAKTIFSLVSVFGAGVFLAVCLLDLLPDSIEAIEKAHKLLKWDNEFPIAELCVAIGFVMILFLEQMILHSREMGWLGTGTDLFAHSHGENVPILEDPNEDGQDHHFDPDAHSTVRAILLVFALSLHAVFEGLSLGMLIDVNVLFQVFGALFIHKTLIGFSLGIRLVQSKLKTVTIILCCIVFAGMVLIGGFFGLGIINILNHGSRATASMVSGTLQAVACGTFLYITCFEILPHELNQKGHRPLKMLCLTLGFIVVGTFIAIFPEKRGGLQIDISSKLVQQKAMLRNSTSGNSSLIESSVGALVSLDFCTDNKGIKNVGLSLSDPSIAISEAIFGYGRSHFVGKQYLDTFGMLNKKENAKESLMPFIKVNLDNLKIDYNTSKHKSLQLVLAKVASEINWDHRKLSIDFKGFCLNEHHGISYFKCGSFCIVSSNRVHPESEDQQIVDSTILSPLLVLDQNDLVWWINYAKQLEIRDMLTPTADKSGPAFSEHLMAEENKKKVVKPKPFNIYFNLELSAMHLLLRNSAKEGVDLMFGIDLVTFNGDGKLNNFELGIDSLWCHRNTSLNKNTEQFYNIKIDFLKHSWGTTFALGAGLFHFKQMETQNLLQIQLDDLQIEWEESVVEELATFAKSLIAPFQSQRKCPPSNDTNPKPLKIQLSQKKLSVFFNAKQSAFLVLNVHSLRFDFAKDTQRKFDFKLEEVNVGFGQINEKEDVSTVWFNKKQTIVERCGKCDKLNVVYINSNNRSLIIKVDSSFHITWSPLAYVVFYEILTLTRKLHKKMGSNKNNSVSKALVINVMTLEEVEFTFKLPRERTMIWRVPSIHFQWMSDEFSVVAPNLVIQIDTEDIFKFEQPSIQKILMEEEMSEIRKGMAELETRANKTWVWSADALSAVFPYDFNFATAWEEVINSIKWMKKVHKHIPKPFTADSPLPSDVKICINKFTFQINDDPFEVKLQENYELQVDEVYEMERRRRLMCDKIRIIAKQYVGEAKDGMIEALNNGLKLKNSQLYIDRNKNMGPSRTQLFVWTITDWHIRAFADSALHGKENVIKLMQQFNPESGVGQLDQMNFSTMWAREVEMDFVEMKMNFRDYPLEYMFMKDAHFLGKLVGAEHLAGGRSIRNTFIDLPEPWGHYQLDRNMCPIKYYYDLSAEVDQYSMTYGPCWEPCLSMISLCFNNVNQPSRDPSPNLSFWDKMRLLLHGSFSMMCKKFVTRMLASSDPRNTTELIEIVWNNYAFDWTTGQFRIQTDVDAFVRTPSKYDDLNVLHLPGFKLEVQLKFACNANPFDHHGVTPCAPNKLPDYSTNHEHDSYRAFRSSHVNVIVHFEVKTNHNSPKRGVPQILLYANTFRWFDFMKNTLTTVNRPIKRGTLFNKGKKVNRKFQLSRHFKDVHISVTLPKFMISYWMSSNSSHGFRMTSDSLYLTADLQLHHLKIKENENMIKRQKVAWKLNHMSALLIKAQIHLFGDNAKPKNDTDLNDSDESFFLGMSRITYIRESIQKNTPIPPRRSSVKENYNASMAAVHRLTVHDVRASWTTQNRDTCFIIAEGVHKAHVLRKVLSTDALKNWMFNSKMESPKDGSSKHDKYFPANEKKASRGTSIGSQKNQESDEMLSKLVEEAQTNFVAWHENTVDPPSNSLHGVTLCTKEDVILHNWQIDLLNCQAVLKGHETDGFVLLTAARAAITENIHSPVWRDMQLLGKTSWTAVLSGMQYFAPLLIGKDKNSLNKNQFSWLKKDVIEEKISSDPNAHDKVNNYSSTGEAVGGVVSEGGTFTNSNGLQLQRVASRCSCQMFFVFFTDSISMEDLGINVIVPPLPPPHELSSKVFLGNRKENVDCFTLKHNMLEVSTNSEQYQMILDIINNLVLYVDPHKKQAEGKRRRLWFEYSQMDIEAVRTSVTEQQERLREIIARNRIEERRLFFLNKECDETEESTCLINQMKQDIDHSKIEQSDLIDKLALTISCFREKEVELESKATKNKIKSLLFDQDSAIMIAKRFEVCFESCVWKLTETDGQISLSEMQIRNFLYTRTEKTNNSGEHLLEIGAVKVLNLIPNSKYKETLTKIPRPGNGPESERVPSIRVICRDLPPVGGISIKEHFEVNVCPMQTQITNSFYRQMMLYFFPGRNLDSTDQQNLDLNEDNSQSSQPGSSVAPPNSGNRNSLSFANKFKGTIHGSFRRQSNDNGKLDVLKDDIDKMKSRAENNNMFVYIKIPEVPFVVSYKGTKEKNMIDLERYHFIFPLCEYHNRNWTWLDLAMAIKYRCRKVLAQQFMKQKFFRHKIIGNPAMMALPSDLNEEEKKRIVLGSNTMNDKDKGKKKR